MRELERWLPWLILAGLGYGAYRLFKSGAFDPTSPNNLAYKGANSVTQAVTGNPNATTGGAIYDVLNPNAGASASAVFRILTFPDGVKRSVDLSSVDSDGNFDYGNNTFWMSPDRQAVLVA